MTISQYYKELRAKIGSNLLLIPGVAASIIVDDKILLQNKGEVENWSLPAGAIEPGESPQEAIVREVKEETGLLFEPDGILGVFGGKEYRYTYPNGDSVESIVILFTGQIIAGRLEANDPETVGLEYFDYNSMPFLALPYPKDVLFNRYGKIYF